jgi:hypothetical protein
MAADDGIALFAHNAGPNSLIFSSDCVIFRYDLANVQQRVKARFDLETNVLRGEAMQMLRFTTSLSARHMSQLTTPCHRQ